MTDQSKITHQEMVELFGSTMPVEAVNLLFSVDGDTTCGEVRAELRRIAEKQKAEVLKLYCIFAKESLDKMKGIRGKMFAQAGHAFVHSYWDSVERFPSYAERYRDSRQAFKITLVVPTVADLVVLHQSYREVCGVSLVTDAGLTVFNEPTTTCLGMGPIPHSLIKDDLGKLKTLT